MNQAIESGTAGQLLCQDPRCRTVLPGDAEICDECGAANLRPIDGALALLLEQAHKTAENPQDVRDLVALGQMAESARRLLQVELELADALWPLAAG